MYTRALEHTPTSAVLYANRALALLKLSLAGEAEEDCETALLLQPSLLKARGPRYPLTRTLPLTEPNPKPSLSPSWLNARVCRTHYHKHHAVPTPSPTRVSSRPAAAGKGAQGAGQASSRPL